MTALGQVIHVVRKDVGVARWFLLAYAALLAFGMYLLLVEPRGIVMLSATLSVLAAWLVTGVAVQADPATRPDAFWVTRPLSPGAVFSAKLVFIAGVIALGLAAQLYVLRIHAVPAHDILAEGGTLVLWMSVTLTIAILVAALTRDLSGFLVGSMGVFLLWQVPTLLRLFVRSLADSGATVGLPWTALWYIALLALTAWQYRTRNARTGRIALVALILVGVFAGPILPATADGDVAAHPTELSGRIEATGRSEQVRLHGDLPLSDTGSDVRAALIVSGARIIMPDGTEEAVRLVDQDGRDMMRRLADDPVWTASYPEGIPLAIMHLSEAQLAAIHDTGAPVVVEGTVVVRRALHLATLPLDDHAVHTSSGIRMRIDSRNTVPGAEVAVTLSGATDTGAPGRRGGDDLVYTLSGSAAGDTVRLERQQSGSGSGTLVLPSSRGWTRSEVLRTPQHRNEATAGSTRLPWPQGARLRVSTWREVARYQVRITAHHAGGGV